ncbi:MAG: hypothetical protein PVI57_21450 [Gemmatimonadota bacterium]|jgi:hypothetical protein
MARLGTDVRALACVVAGGAVSVLVTMAALAAREAPGVAEVAVEQPVSVCDRSDGPSVVVSLKDGARDGRVSAIAVTRGACLRVERAAQAEYRAQLERTRARLQRSRARLERESARLSRESARLERSGRSVERDAADLQVLVRQNVQADLEREMARLEREMRDMERNLRSVREGGGDG